VIWETVVLMHLTTKEGWFVRPQYDIAWDKEAGEGGTCPDFVAIDPNQPGLIYVIEVSAASNLSALNERFENRHKYWYGPLGRLAIWDTKPSQFKAIAYTRKDAAKFTCTADDIERRYLEDIAFLWKS
jgi:hypothetical protein